eukprot:CAMPEP_0185846818 /NCGR_PEP_ID=MMETSP1354-20130828/2325_1 /TAXON_ID=708628 /ORGANISM="Erythrolobus madagascarensis, Strain CCMP3276" /LENGTH=98 /DNA_ID=CAMNT_0028547025 /DNA_START=72 /DNA_END=368 /DNA_ORIENTATION=-
MTERRREESMKEALSRTRLPGRSCSGQSSSESGSGNGAPLWETNSEDAKKFAAASSKTRDPGFKKNTRTKEFGETHVHESTGESGSSKVYVVSSAFLL